MGSKERIEREKEKRREEIIAAAEKYFLRKGVASTTMDEIAKECELSKGTLYLYFESKEKLFHVIVLRAISAMFDLMFDLQSGVTLPVDRLRMIGEAHFRFYEEYPDHFRILSGIFDHEHDHSEPDDSIGLIEKKNGEVWGLIHSIIKDGIADGTFKKETDPVEISLGLFSISTMMIKLMDHMARHKKRDIKNSNFPEKVDFRKMIENNCMRFILSIMNDK